MKLPLSWLKDYVDIDISVDELKNKLFSCGFEVEEVIETAKNIDRIVTCKIEKVEKHPNADKLSVTQVNAGDFGKFQIITAATNIFEGAVVPVALDNSTLDNGKKINTGELRGLTSFGMFCSGEELGITDDWFEGASVHGILILDKDTPLGKDIKEVLDLKDYIFDINVTANRSDCQSVLGLAREVATVLDKPLKMPDLDYTVEKGVSTEKTIKVKNKATDLCPRYISHLVENVTLFKSPMWLRRRLFRVGIRSINNIVDITNFVLTEIGQPMHAFDLSNLEKNEIIIRRAENGEKITTLDEKTFTLNENNLVICDGVKPVALAGIMGGLNSEIKETTKNVVFESAKFARDNIRKSSRALGQRSDSSSRYEKGVDAFTTEIGMKRALNLICALNCGKVASDGYDICEPLKPKVINTTANKINAVLGIEVPTKDIVKILENLYFTVKEDKGDLTVTAPLFREDIEDYPDLAEEVIREYGYSNIIPTLLKTSEITAGGKTDEQKEIDELKNLLTGYGFNEIITYSFVSQKEYDLYGLDKDSEEYRFIKLINPLGEDMAVMRTSLIPSIVSTVCYNLNRKNEKGRLFEFAKTYHPKELPLKDLPTEKSRLSFALFGEGEDFFTTKAVSEGIINYFCFGKKAVYKPSNAPYLHQTRSADLFIDDTFVGRIGQISPELTEKLGADKPIYVGEIYYDVLSKFFNSKIVFSPISKYPSVERDLAVTVDEDVACGLVVDCIKEVGGDILAEVSLFDVYRGDQIASGKKSLAFNLFYISCDRTLSVEEVETSITAILKNLREKTGAELR